VILTVPGAADRPGAAAVGLAPWTTFTVTRQDDGGELTVLAVPAVHGPEDGERDAQGHINCEVTGFVLSGQGLPTLYVSGGNASIRAVAEISRRVPGIDAAVLNAGAARVKGKFRERPVSMDGRRAAAAVLGVSVVIPAHYRVPPAYGWNGPRPSKPAGQTSASEAGVSAVDGHVRHGTALRPTGALPRWPVKTRIR
jgi:L-ascorbate metabolism protein UlaG (beta-lactamase superfamily)